MKKIISVLLVVLLAFGTTMPVMYSFAESETDDSIKINAQSPNTLTITEKDKLPYEDDYSGNLYIASESFEIERDYNQACKVSVTNNSSKNIEYYLTAKNTYDDLYMNFVRNGSVDAPLVIQPGETQQVQLDVFAQNANGGEYEIPIYATVVEDENESTDAKATITLYCDSVSLNFGYQVISTSESTLEKKIRLTNRGSALTDVTVSMAGEAADYVLLNPIVSNYQMNYNDSVEISAAPDLTKMKTNNKSLVEGQLVVSSGDKTQSFDISFDTLGQEITSMTMGRISLMQSGNPYYDFVLIDQEGNYSGAASGETFSLQREEKLSYGDGNIVSLSMDLSGNPGNTTSSNEIVLTADGYDLLCYKNLTKYMYAKYLLDLELYELLFGKTYLQTLDFNKLQDDNYVLSYRISLNGNCFSSVEDAIEDLKLWTLAIIGDPSNRLYKDPNASVNDILGYCSECFFSFFLEPKNNIDVFDNEKPLDYLIDAQYTIEETYFKDNVFEYKTLVSIPQEGFLPFKYIQQIELDAEIEPTLQYSLSIVEGKRLYSSKDYILFELDNEKYIGLLTYLEQTNGKYTCLLMAVGISGDSSTSKGAPQLKSKKESVAETVYTVGKHVVKWNTGEFNEFFDLIDTGKNIHDLFNTENTLDEANMMAASYALLDKIEEFDKTSSGQWEIFQLKTDLMIADLFVKNSEIARLSKEIAKNSNSLALSDSGKIGDITADALNKSVDTIFGNLEKQVNDEKHSKVRDTYLKILNYCQRLQNELNDLMDQYGEKEGVRRFLEKYGHQCTNAGAITSKPYIGSSIGMGVSSIGETDTPPKPPVTNVQLSQTSIKGNVDNTFDLNVAVSPSNADVGSITWTSSNTNVAIVDEDGKVTFVGGGTATITVKAGEKTATCDVEVEQSSLRASFDPSTLTIPVGRVQPTSIVLSSEDDVLVLSKSFYSTDPAILDVDTDGNIYGLAFGEATIVATIETNQGTVTSSAAVKVTLPAQGVFLGNVVDTWRANIGETVTYQAQVYPAKANQAVFWESSDPSVATVDDHGTVQVVGLGESVITVTSVDGGFTDTMTVVGTNEPRNFIRKGNPTNQSNNSGIEVYITSRMFGGEGVNRWYHDDSADYVDIADTTYRYTVNGVDAGFTSNSGVTDVAIAKLPTNLLKFGAVNTIVCDYDTNPGHYFVNTDTQISILYPSDTLISFIGTPSDIEDIRSLPDFAIYSENIFGEGDVIVGDQTNTHFKMYNRGSSDGWCDIIVTVDGRKIYTESNHFLKAFTGETITVSWVPEMDKQDVQVKLVNKTVGLEDCDSQNNTASRTFGARSRIVPSILSITPDYAVEGEGIVFATVEDYNDVLKAEFYIDDVLYTGEVKSSVVNAQERFWINDTSMSVGSKKIKVVVTYDKGFGETGTVELEKTLEVLNKDWNRLTFKMDRSLSNVKYFIYDSVNNSYSRVYGVERNGDTATITITKDIYDHPENYILCVTCNQGFLYQVMNTEMDFDLAKCHILTFVTADHMSLSSVTIKSFDGRSFDNTSYSSTMMLTPGLYSFDVTFYYFDEYRRVSVDVDLAAEDQTIDLSQYITKFMFRFTDGAPVETDVQLFYKNSEDDAWNSLYLDSDLNDTDLICAVPSYYADLLTSVSDAVVCVKTEDSAYAINALPIREVSKNTITLRKNDLQKYTVSASADEADFDVLEVRVSCDKFSLSFYTTTIYLTPDAYEITVFCKDKDLEDVFETKAVLSEDRIIKVDWAAGYLEKDAYVYALDSTGVAFTKPAVKTGDFINVQRSVYQVKTNLIRNDSYYTVESYVDTTEQNADLFIGDAFSGVITNSFGTYKEGASLTLYLDQLYDNNGNKLTYFNSQNEEDNLSGFVVLTNKANTEDIKYIPVSLSSLSSFTVELPEGPGEYAVSIDLSTNSDLIHPIEVPNVESISLNVDEITLNCKQTYQLELVVSPSEAEMPKVIWASSDDSVASVDETGLIQTSNLKRGSATITAQTEDGSMLAQCKVTVKFTLLQWIVWFVTGGLVKDIFNKLKAMVKA